MAFRAVGYFPRGALRGCESRIEGTGGLSRWSAWSRGGTSGSHFRKLEIIDLVLRVTVQNRVGVGPPYGDIFF